MKIEKLENDGREWFRLTGIDYGTGGKFQGEIYGLNPQDGKILDCDGYPLTEGDWRTVAVRNALKNSAAVALGSIKTAKKAASSRENGKKGGRPPYRWAIRDREAGNVIDKFTTREAADAALDRYERTDRLDGIYAPNFYEIVKLEKGE